MDNLFRSKTETLLAILIVIIFLPLVIFDMPFRDDLNRSYWGFVGLSQLGRPFADVLYKILGFGFEGVNLSPLPKLLSLTILIASSLVVYRKIFHSKGFMGLLVCAVLFANPFSLQNFAYQYDCLPMAMSVFFASVTACYSSKNRVTGVLFSSTLIFLSLSLYQASIVISGCLYLCVIYRRLSENESIQEIIKDALCLLLSSFIAIASYYLLIVASLSSISKRSEIAGFMRINENLLFLYARLHELYTGAGYLFLIIAFSVLLSLVMMILRRQVLNALLYTVLFFLLAVTSIMPSVILDEGFVGPRVLMSIATLLLFSSLIIIGRVANITFTFAAGILVLHSTVMSYAFSGDLRAQLKRYQTLSSLVINETQSKEGVNYEKVFIHCASSISTEEKVFVRFNRFISWLNPEEPWAIRFFIRNSGEDRIVNDWGNCGEADFSRGDKGNTYFSKYAKDNNLHFIMK